MDNKWVSMRNMEVHGYRYHERNILRYGAYGERDEDKLKEQEVQTICNYLENPTRVGIWALKAKWKNIGGISGDIINKIKEKFRESNIEIQSGKRIIKFKEEERDELIINIQRLSFIIRLFTNLVRLDNKTSDSFRNYLESEGPEIKLSFDIWDPKDIKKEYSEAFEYFKTNIYFENFDSHFEYGRIERIKEGILIFIQSLNEGKDNRYIISDKSAPLEKIKVFFEKVDKISNSTIMPIYSPEEEVFAPYFVFLEQTYNHLIDIDHIIKLFQKSISEYNDEDYSHCISTIGLIIEDYLIQVYETFLKDVCPKGLTMGELFNLIQGTVDYKFKKPISVSPEIKPLYGSINELIKAPTDGSFNLKISTLIRDLLTYIKKDKAHVLNVVDISKKKGSDISVFPKNLISNIKEAIRNRNAISHKSTVPIGRYEALRTVYCCITLIIWWNNEKKTIDWKQTSDEILKTSIERNTGITLT